MATVLSIIAILVTGLGSYYTYKAYRRSKETKDGLANVEQIVSELSVSIDNSKHTVYAGAVGIANGGGIGAINPQGIIKL